MNSADASWDEQISNQWQSKIAGTTYMSCEYNANIFYESFQVTVVY